ncbi:BsuPI-related putative proteinase inhibitor [Halalkalibacillus halophilus]|uniref:BsuPI-related putative proteinase inhibitor n=1 Tax=Halalkalibacillus halophilus TaxID=392827 RepID=UPI0003FF14B5|nr:BsuPI-related putative proteinase inhibitor [Halalkalibacillus halophilus]
MKKILLLLFAALLLVLVACNNNDDEAEEEENEEVEEEENEEDDETGMMDMLTFNVDTETEEEYVTFQMNLTNDTEDEVELTFNSAQRYEIVISDAEGEEVYRYSDDMMFTQAIDYVDLAAGDTLELEQQWDYRGSDGQRLEEGTYDYTVELVATEINGEEIEEGIYSSEGSIDIPATEENNEQADDVDESGSTSGDSSEDNSSSDNSGSSGEEDQSGEGMFRNVEVTGSSGSYTVTGEAEVPEGAFQYTVEDGHMMLVEEETVQIEGGPGYHSFEIEVDIPEEDLPNFGVISMVLYWYNSETGEQDDHYPVTLESLNQ